VTKALKSPEWARIAKARGWDDAYLDADAFAAFLKADQQRVKDVLTSIGLVK
jgi:putative tricarboxylic transport membrane protein